MDRIQNPVLTQEPRDPLPQGMELSRYMRERVYQIAGTSIHAVLRCEIRKPQRLRRELAQTLGEGWELYRAPLVSLDDHQMLEEETQDE